MTNIAVIALTVALLLLSCAAQDADSLEGITSVGTESLETVNGSGLTENANNSTDKPKETIAQVLGDALKEEFKHEEEQREAEVGKQFNETLAAKGSETMQETVIIISQKKAAANRTAEAEAASLHEAASTSSDSIKLGDNDTSKDNSTSIEKPRMDVAMETDVDRIIDSHDNEYVLSKANEDGSMSLTLDYQFVRDLTILICASAAGGLAMELLGQPTINGYFIAGSLIGPGGLDLVKEIVQVQSVAQLGVFFLLFTLGMEFSIGKLRAVREVALLGGAAQLLCFAALGGFGGRIIGSSAPIGAFLGALLGMSSTSIVVKCLSDRGRANTIPGQITIGTLVFQDCVVGLLFASMPVISSGLTSGGSNNVVELAVAILKVLSRIAFVLVVAFIATRLVLPKAARALAKNADNEVIQMVAIGFCLAAAMGTAKLGISAELGAFIAGVMVSGTEQSDSVLVLVDSVAHIFLALFISSTGLILAPRFLFHHLPLLAAGVMVIIVAKTLVIAATVMLFKYSLDVALSVGINLAQIGELAFVLLSLATGRNLIPNEVYLLLMGVCALSLLLTPFLLQASAKLCPKSKSSVHELERHNSGGLMGYGTSSAEGLPDCQGGTLNGFFASYVSIQWFDTSPSLVLPFLQKRWKQGRDRESPTVNDFVELHDPLAFFAAGRLIGRKSGGYASSAMLVEDG